MPVGGPGQGWSWGTRPFREPRSSWGTAPVLLWDGGEPPRGATTVGAACAPGRGAGDTPLGCDQWGLIAGLRQWGNRLDPFSNRRCGPAPSGPLIRAGPALRSSRTYRQEALRLEKVFTFEGVTLAALERFAELRISTRVRPYAFDQNARSAPPRGPSRHRRPHRGRGDAAPGPGRPPPIGR